MHEIKVSRPPVEKKMKLTLTCTYNNRQSVSK